MARNTRPQRSAKAAAPHNRETPGLKARALAIDILDSVLHRGATLDEALAKIHAGPDWQALARRDRGLTRLIATTVLRRSGQLRAVVGKSLSKPLPASGARAQLILLAGAAQLLFLDLPAHAVIDTAVRLSRENRASARFDKLINAVLRRVNESGRETVASQDAAALNFPEWLIDKWRDHFGEASAHAMALASLQEPARDITAKSDADAWAERLGGDLLPTGSIRCTNEGPIAEMVGFGEGAWWVQDAAAALPACLLAPVAGRRIADLCAAPGGKTAQLAALGGQVTAVDISQPRLDTVASNLARLDLAAELVVADARQWQPERTFDAVLVDAPCTATGTIRRHPDILHLRRQEDVARMRELQSAILANAARMIDPGGVLVYCTCSLEPEEGEHVVESFLSAHDDFTRAPIAPSEIGDQSSFLTANGDLRTLPSHWPATDARPGGLDGFYASRLRRL